jgi:hypothetical protein
MIHLFQNPRGLIKHLDIQLGGKVGREHAPCVHPANVDDETLKIET